MDKGQKDERIGFDCVFLHAGLHFINNLFVYTHSRDIITPPQNVIEIMYT